MESKEAKNEVTRGAVLRLKGVKAFDLWSLDKLEPHSGNHRLHTLGLEMPKYAISFHEFTL